MSHSSRMRLPAPLAEKYRIIRDIGQGAYGLVCQAENLQTGEMVAIKKVTRISEKEILVKRCLREIKLLRHFNGHDNIISLLDIYITDPKNFSEVYLIQELMEADLHQIIKSGQPLTDAHFQYFLFQICRGLKYIHSVNVLHRDLKPGNLLVNANCALRICDFGLARGCAETPEGNAGFMTEYVATRWYRAPEIMLSFQSYTKAIDMWAIGCIFAELLGGKPLFKGRDYVDQLNQILGILGTPDTETLERVGSERAQMYIKALPHMPRIPFSTLFPNATPEALDLLGRLLDFDPSSRITVDEALAHPYMKAYHDLRDEPDCPMQFDFSFEYASSISEVKDMIAHEVASFRNMAAEKAGLDQSAYVNPAAMGTLGAGPDPGENQGSDYPMTNPIPDGSLNRRPSAELGSAAAHVQQHNGGGYMPCGTSDELERDLAGLNHR
ncbi:mitogen activated protein kinase [Mycoemilia scoparia]|uniref:Mitogen activated protein kinase n=1 Tax=Mycoemilia scoparia TaxID=417184 RepID=A0A9W8A3P2_9FUNG|nr:mitogen activated protein kinase [Mycoemilia scoparia]